jgi:hypothetical protein
MLRNLSAVYNVDGKQARPAVPQFSWVSCLAIANEIPARHGETEE